MNEAPSWRRLLGPVVAYRVLVLLFVVAVPSFFPRLWSAGNYGANFHWPPDAPATVARAFTSWDGEHCIYLAEHGYTPNQESNRVWPLWPLAIRLASLLTLGHVAFAAVALANLLAVLATLLFHRVAALDHPERADDATLIFLAFPGSLFLAFPYTESLFVVLVLAWYLGLKRDRTAWAAAAGFALPLVRVVGMAVIVPAAYEVWKRWRTTRGVRLVDVGLLLAPLLGFVAYLGFMQMAVGNAFEAFDLHRQNRLFGETARSALDLGAFVHAIGQGTDLTGPLTSALDRVWFLLLLPALAYLWRRDRTQFLFAAVMGVVPAVSNLFFGYTRFVVPVFPLFLAAAIFFGGEARRPWKALLLMALFALQVVQIARHTSYQWVA